nr:putative RNA-directed DNA polymerase, eukaryota, reverse transcriptase zinc-binding domain protein [Tanacetum cinerariifolium]GEW21165.1 putative RNA-directed DNA polymerase, eukaryota, reverse transcriptase zinc-binding domain protein [Tanacetum cinerariifolium]
MPDNHRSNKNFNRRHFNSDEDLTRKISHSVFATNFPDCVISRDLWKECSVYGTVVDVFIPTKKSKAGDECFVERDFSKYAMGRVKDINSIPNTRIILADEGFEEVKFFYLGGKWMLFEFAMIESKEKLINHTGINSWFHVIQDGFYDFVSDERIIWMDIEGIPLRAWSRETFSRIGKKWGEILDIEDKSDSSFGRKRLCICTKHPISIIDSFKIIVKGKVFMVRAKELFTWNPVFLFPDEKAYSSDDESVCGVKEKEVRSQSNEEEEGEFVASDVKEVVDTNFENGSGVGDVAVNNFDNGTDMLKQHNEVATTHSEDLFGLYKILNKKLPVTETSGPSPSLTHPPGFSPPGSAAVNQNVQNLKEVANNTVEDDSPLISANVMHTSQHIQEDYSGNLVGIGKDKNGGSVLGVLEEVIRIGRAMGYDMNGCEKDVENIIRNQGDESVFKKDNVMISDNFVAIYGIWIPNESKILLVAIYAPQQPLYKRFLWEYLSILLSRWSGEAIFMGDFNEVRSSDERRGSWFNTTYARIFNNFISSASLVDVKMEGYSFTWSHPSAICLDRHLSDHRPILLCEVNLDFGPTPFRFYHSWFNYDGFDAMILKKFIRGWIKDKKSKSSSSRRIIEEELCNIDKQLEKDRATDQILHRRHDLVCQLKDIDHMIASDSIQKSKVSWAIEGDENSKFFHGIINKKRSHLAVRGVFEEGSWITDPTHVKKAFRVHFESRFQKPSTSGLKLNFEFPNRLSSILATDLERDVSHDEIKSAVWDCGCNSPFIALIPKVSDAKFVNDYRSISLIGSVYKVFSKILANRLSLVIEGIVSNTQSAFVADRQILDGPFILNEVLQWCKKMHKKALFLKVNFAKAYDSVRWDFLIDVLEAFGFGSKWCKWIRGTFCFAKASVLVNGSPSDEFQFHGGLKQGDPLSPFLFILVMESLHLSVNRAINDGLFKGIRLNDDISLSHLFYADDAMFVGEWSDANLRGLCRKMGLFGFILSKPFMGIRLIPLRLMFLLIGFRFSRKFKCLSGVVLISYLIALKGWETVSTPFSVAEKLSSYLVVSFRRVVRGGAEQQQLSDLSSLLTSVLLAPIPDHGGMLIGKVGPLLRSGNLGSILFGSPSKSKAYWKECFSWLGGRFGG